MKKRFIAVMFAGLFAASAGFVSCSDYDDDISDLRSLIAKNEGSIAELNAKIQNGTAIKSVTPVGNGIEITLANGQSYTITNGVDGKDGKDGVNGTDGAATVVEIREVDGAKYWFINGVNTGYPAQGEKGDKGDQGEQGIQGEKGDKGDQGAPGAAGATGAAGAAGATGAAGKDGDVWEPREDGFCYKNGEKQNLKWTIAEDPNAVHAIVDDWYVTLLNVNGEIVKIAKFCYLKGLVFQPEFYYQGIEAFEFYKHSFKAITLENNPKGVNDLADGDYSGDKVKSIAKDPTVLAPEITATYHMNPTNARVEEDVNLFGFDVLNRVTRAAATNPDFIITGVKVKDGKLSINARYDFSSTDELTSGTNVTVVALQYAGTDANGNESKVTSDYAAVLANEYANYRLAHPTKTDTHTHLYTTAQDAIDNAPEVNLLWDDEDGIDLREYVTTCRTLNGSTSDKLWHDNAVKALNDKLFADGTFKYEFELLGYKTSTTDKTSQSVHAVINPENGYQVRAQLTKDGKQQEWGAENSQNVATVGRMPLVRVRLMNETKIVAVGYLKLNIVSKTAEPEEVPYIKDVLTVTENYTINCKGSNVFEEKVTWSDIEEKVYAKLNMTKAEFEANYDIQDSKTNIKQYNDKGKEKSTVPESNVGKFEYWSDTQSGSTEILTWSITDTEAYELIRQNPNKTSFTTYLCFKKKSGSTLVSKPEAVFLQFIWNTPKPNITPTATFADAKIKSYWYASNSITPGRDEIHGSVEVIGRPATVEQKAADDDYIFDIKSTLVGNKLEVKGTDPYKGLNYTTKVYFVDGYATNSNGGNVKLYANTAGTELHTTAAAASQNANTLVATIDPATGIVYYGSTGIKGNANSTALELLNNYADLDKVVTANVKVVATYCETASWASKAPAVTVTEDKFAVKFLRPLTVESAGVTLQDGKDGGDTQKVNLTFVDWRGLWGTGAAGNTTYLQYYGVKNIAVDKAKATTDLNGNASQLLKDVAPNLDLQYTAPASVAALQGGDYGKIYYGNLGVVVSTFKIYLPATLEYDWGKVPFTIEVTVKGTLNNTPKEARGL